MLCVTLRSHYFVGIEHLAALYRGEHGHVGIILRGIIAALAVHSQEAVETHYLPCSREMFATGARSDFHSCLFYLRIGHLRRYRTFPYQRVKSALLLGSVYIMIGYICRTYGLVCLLRSF